jgi:lipoprotein-anchoring transpeptidase ErfK/SrfK
MTVRNIPHRHIISGLCLLGIGVFFYFALKTSTASKEDHTTALVQTVKPSPETISARYRSIKVVTDKPGAEIAREVGLSHTPFVLTFNRLDDKHISKNTTIIIPSELSDWHALSPFPDTLLSAQDIPKLLLVSQRIQAIGAYEYGRLVRWMVTSTGKQETPTPSKLYFTNWKGKLVTSSVKDEWILPWYFNLDNTEGISLHQYELPGYPASHSCVRLTEADAQWIYDWAEQWILAPDEQTKLASGTPVIVFGEYAYTKIAPWKRLAQDPLATTLSTDELNSVVLGYLPTIQAEAQRRNTLQQR